jgi:hypothetical protein
MNLKTTVAIVLFAACALPHTVSAMTAFTEPTKVHKSINSKHPGTPGFTNSSPLGSAEKAALRAKKKAAKEAAKALAKQTAG